jgi:predicted ester cyclase
VSETNKEIVSRFFEEIFNNRNPDASGDLVAKDYVEHALAPFGDREPGRVDGPLHVRAVAEWLFAQFPDGQMKVEAVISEGDLVAARVLGEGTNLGKLNGVIPPTGKHFSSRQSHWFRVEHGKLTEHWAIRDDLTAMLQLGVVSRPGPPLWIRPLLWARRRTRS